MKPFHREQTRGVLLVVPQGASRRAGERLPLDPRLQRLRQLAGIGVSGQGARSFYYPPAAAAVRRLPHAAGRLERSGGQERQGAVASVPGGEHGAAVRQQGSGAAEGGPGLPARRTDLRRRLRHHPWRPIGGRRPESRPVAERGRRAAALEHICGRRGVGSFGAGCRHLVAPPAAEVLGAARQDLAVTSGAANRSASRSWCARERSATSSPAARSTRSTSGSSSKRSTTRGASCSTAAPSRTMARARSIRPRTSIAACQLDEHGNPINKRNAWMTRSVAYVRLIPPAPPTPCITGCEIPKDAGIDNRPACQGQLPQVRLVEHAVGVCRRPRSGATRRRGLRVVRRWQVAVQRRHVEGVGAGQGDSRHPDHGDGPVEATLARHRRARAAAGSRSRSWTHRSASAGTTTASACCCRAI